MMLLWFYSGDWKISSLPLCEGVSHWFVTFKLPLTDRNMQVRFCLKVVLESWDSIFLGITTSFCEILTVSPQLDQMWTTDILNHHHQFHLFFVQFCLIFASFLIQKKFCKMKARVIYVWSNREASKHFTKTGCIV